MLFFTEFPVLELNPNIEILNKSEFPKSKSPKQHYNIQFFLIM